MRFPHNTHSPTNYLAHPTAPLLHILSRFDQRLAAAAALPGAGGRARAADGNGRSHGSIPGGERNLGGNATTAVATTAAATDCVDVVVVNNGGGSPQCPGNNVLTPLVGESQKGQNLTAARPPDVGAQAPIKIV
jgi:hypothetical protein